MATLQINDLHVDVETEAGPKQILKGCLLYTSPSPRD